MLWSRFFASSTAARYSSSSFALKKAVPYILESMGRFSSPLQYAPATWVSLKAGIMPVEARCGPRQRSMKSPCL